MQALTKMKTWLAYRMAFAGGMLAGAAVMYLQDPDRGRRRRALVRDKTRWLLHRGEVNLDRSMRDLSNRVLGLIYETSAEVALRPVGDEVLRDRIRARIGRLVSNPHAIHVTVKAGAVTLEGPVFLPELDRLVTRVRLIRGVHAVDNRLTVYDKPEKIHGLSMPHPQDQFELLRPHWAPATRLVVGATGLALTAAGARKRGLGGIAMGMLGSGMLTRALVNDHLASFANLDGHGSEITVQKTITIDAPLERVFEMMVGPERLPKVMTHIREVKKTGENQYLFTFLGPVETPLRCEARITKLETNKLLEWESVPDSAIRNGGVIHFDSLAGGGTRVHIQMYYVPPGGALAHAVAEVLAADPKHMLDEDLARLKSLLEVGKTHAHHAAVRIEDLGGPVWVGKSKVPDDSTQPTQA